MTVRIPAAWARSKMSVPRAYPLAGTYSFQRTICFAGQVPTSMEECEGRVMLGMMVWALKVYAPLCIKDNTFFIFAFSMASGRSPSKLTIKTRLTLGAGVNVTVGGRVTVAGGSGVFGTRVSVGSGAGVGTEREANGMQLCKSKVRMVKIQILLNALKIIYPTSQK